MTLLFNTAYLLCILTLVSYAVATFCKHKAPSVVALIMMALSSAAIAVFIVARWKMADRAPFSNMFESLVLFAWAVTAIYMGIRIKYRLPVLGAASALLATIVVAFSSFKYGEDIEHIQPLVPALQSNWLTFHVLTCFLGYGGFAISFVAAIGYLVVARHGSKATQETQDAFSAVMANTISFGFLFLTVGIITGSVWANSAWGTYWSWDPKETWSLITWIIYAIFLHCRFMRGWKGKRAAWVSIIGFASVLFTYFGVNYLLAGLHSYA